MYDKFREYKTLIDNLKEIALLIRVLGIMLLKGRIPTITLIYKTIDIKLVINKLPCKKIIIHMGFY
jgi:hypothetical protein